MKKLFVAIGALVISQSAFAADLTIMHTSDIHGRISPVKYEGVENRGGLAKRVTYFNQVRNDEKNVLMLDSGDYFQGSLYYTLYKGEKMAKLMKYAKIDAMALGNHEFDDQQEGLRKIARRTKVPMLCANVEFSDKYLKKRIKPYVIKEFQGEKVLIIGVTTPDLLNVTSIKGVKVFDPILKIDEILKSVPHDYAIVLSHCGINYDKLIAKALNGVDLILGGHDHIDYFSNVNSTTIAHHGSFGVNVGVLKVDTETKAVDNRVKILDSKVLHDVTTEQKIAKINKDVEIIKSQVVANSKITLNGDQNYVEKNQSNLGQLILKSMVMPFDDVDVAVLQSGSIRINKDILGKITQAEVLELLPFQGEIIYGELQGRYLKQILYAGKKHGNAYLQVYNRVKKIDNNKIYKVVTNDYLAAGKDGYYSFLKMQNKKVAPKNTTDLLVDFFKQNPVITEDTIKF